MQRPVKRTLVSFSTTASILVVSLLVSAPSYAASDPGVRGGAAGAGQGFANLTTGEAALFNGAGRDQFEETEDVPGEGLGPRFNLDSCVGCHSQPASGGSSPAVNPEVAVATALGARNTVPSFITANGPAREVRFIKNADNTPSGGVQDLFVITGRSDAPANCAIVQPDFATANANNNAIFRIPTPTFGSGLMEAINDTTIVNNLAANATAKANLGIKGRINRNGNDGTVTRFGWKAQNKSLLIFAGEAYNVEMGISNENFTQDREEDPNCKTVPQPNNVTTINADGTTVESNIVDFMAFMKFLDQPKPVTSYTGANGFVSSASIANGRTQFTNVGCALCHTPSLTTGNSSTGALNNVQANLFSDLAVHHMGDNLADGISQGGAGPDEFRSAPLWGVGQRIFFLHDGRTKDIQVAIRAHAGESSDTVTNTTESVFDRDVPGFFDQKYDLKTTETFTGSEANKVITNFNNLSDTNRQDLLNFLRSL